METKGRANIFNRVRNDAISRQTTNGTYACSACPTCECSETLSRKCDYCFGTTLGTTKT